MHHNFLESFEGRYHIPSSIRSDRLAVPNQVEAAYFQAMRRFFTTPREQVLRLPVTEPDVWRSADIASLPAVSGEQENLHCRDCRLGLTLTRTAGVYLTFEEFDPLRLPHSES